MSDLLKNGWCYLENILDKEEISKVTDGILYGPSIIDGEYDSYPGILIDQPIVNDPVRGNVLRAYCPKEAVFLVKRMQPKMEQLIGEELIPTYWFSTVYFNRSRLHAHADRESCEVSISLNLCGEYPWKFKLIDFHGKRQEIVTPPGSGIAYLGTEVLHWRSPLRHDDRFIQLFLHYVRKYGKYAHMCYDNTDGNNTIPYDLLR